jgi:hypothetical protein
MIINNHIKVVDFNQILHGVSNSVVDRIYDIDGDLSGLYKMSNDFRRLLMFHTIKDTCDLILNDNTGYRLVVYVGNISHDIEMVRLSDDSEEMIKVINSCVRSIYSKLPVKVFKSDVSYDEMLSYGSADGEMVCIKNSITHIAYKSRVSSFENIKRFVKANQLTFLSESYFTDIRAKNLLFA